MSEFATEFIEKLHQPPLVHDCTTPTVASDDDGAEGHTVSNVGEPNDGDVPTFTLSDRKYRPRAPAGFVPTFIADGETFFVPANKQALFAMDIDNEGTIELEGYLIQVD